VNSVRARGVNGPASCAPKVSYQTCQVSVKQVGGAGDSTVIRETDIKAAAAYLLSETGDDLKLVCFTQVFLFYRPV